MARRDMIQTAEKAGQAFSETKHLYHYDMNIDEMAKLLHMIWNGEDVEAIIIAFKYGFALGTRAREKNHVHAL